MVTCATSLNFIQLFHIQVEKNVEKIKMACTTTSKKLNMCMLSSGPDAERRKVGFQRRIWDSVRPP